MPHCDTDLTPVANQVTQASTNSRPTWNTRFLIKNYISEEHIWKLS